MRVTVGGKFPSKEPYDTTGLHPTAHLLFLGALAARVIDAGEARLLGDPEWLGRVVARLAPQRPLTDWHIEEAAARAVEGAA
ncbi:hypothetical protein [Streptomyces sp. NPDC003717]|uniref:hypothetical protein n=1 Tax=Streptomyces sp. NPDC003717 TaxID=3154276 RepID=UPI0033B19AED